MKRIYLILSVVILFSLRSYAYFSCSELFEDAAQMTLVLQSALKESKYKNVSYLEKDLQAVASVMGVSQETIQQYLHAIQDQYFEAPIFFRMLTLRLSFDTIEYLTEEAPRWNHLTIAERIKLTALLYTVLWGNSNAAVTSNYHYLELRKAFRNLSFSHAYRYKVKHFLSDPISEANSNDFFIRYYTMIILGKKNSDTELEIFKDATNVEKVSMIRSYLDDLAQGQGPGVGGFTVP